MKYAISVLNIGGFLDPDARESIQAAAERWGCEYHEITKNWIRARCKWFNKFVHAGTTYKGFDGILQLDADVKIRHDAPSPFLEWDHTKLGMVPEWQPEFGDFPARWQWPLCGNWGGFCVNVGFWASRMQMIPPRVEDYVNGGFMLYNPLLAEPWFKEVLKWGKTVKFEFTGLSDQTIVSILCNHGVIPLQKMDKKWNAVHAGTAGELLGPAMDKAYVYHFCARRARAKRMARVNWRLS